MKTKTFNIKSLLVTFAVFLVMSTIAMFPVQALTVYNTPIYNDILYSSYGKNYTCKYGVLTVVVKNADGTFAEGANVKVYNLSDNLVDSGTTGKYGRFITILSQGTYYVVAEKDGSTQTSSNFYLGLIKRVLITLQEKPSYYDITVRVQDSSGYPVSGAKVTIYDGTGTTPLTDAKTTVDDGNVYFALSNGDYMVQVVYGISETWGKLTVSGAPTIVTISI